MYIYIAIEVIMEKGRAEQNKMFAKQDFSFILLLRILIMLPAMKAPTAGKFIY